MFRKVPARMGGVDLSFKRCIRLLLRTVPARMGGVDLSRMPEAACIRLASPRPHGRGGFKQ